MPDIDVATIEQIATDFFRFRKKTLVEFADPYSMDEIILSFKNLRDSFLRLLNGLTENQVTFSPNADTYSLSEIATHLAAMQGNTYNGMIDLSASNIPHIDPVPREPGGGAQKGVSAATLQQQVREATDRLLTLINDVYKADNNTTFEHSFLGLISPRGLMLFQVMHDLDHLRQAQVLRRSPEFPRKNIAVQG